MLTDLTPLVVTNVHTKLHTGKATAWTAMTVAQDVLTSTSVPPKPVIASPFTVQTPTVMFQGHQNVSITTKASVVIVHPVSGLKKVESVSMLTNATLITDNTMIKPTASMMLDHTAAHDMPVGIPLTVMQFASTLMNVISLAMMPFAIMPPVKTLMNVALMVTITATPGPPVLN